MTAPDPYEERPRPGAFVRWEGGEVVLVGEEPSAGPDPEAGPAPSDRRRYGASVEREGEADVHKGHERADQLSRGIMITVMPGTEDLGRTSPEG